MTAPPALLSFALAFARRQPQAEIAHQYEVLARFTLRRRALVTLAFGIGLAYQPFWITALFYLLDVAFDLATLHFLRGLNPATQPGRYLMALAMNAGLATVFATYPALSWHVDDPLAKAYALSLLLIALIHHSTLRNVHLPLSVSASGAATVVALVANTLLWVNLGNARELAITTLCLAAAVYYATLTILAMHKLQSDLLHEREAARQANLAKTRFIAQLSHELRTPLNAIVGLSEAERMMAPQPETKARMGVLVQSARDLGELLEDILDLSAIEAEKLTLRPEVTDLHALIRASAQLYRRQFEDRGMVLDLALASDLPQWVWMDGRRLRQCLSNILSNAVKYGRRGRVQVEARRTASGDLAIRVADNGPGVSEALRERIFEPFVRGHDDGPGTGLGLSISRMLARRMGGDLVLLPQGPGAQFLLTLPFDIVSGPVAPVAPPEGPSFEGLRVLVVDDIATNRLVAATWLRLLGAEPLLAADGAAALEIARTERPDLVLMDLLMPGLDGVDTLERMGALLGSDLPPVIAVSAEEMAVEYGARAAAFDGHLVKPLTLESLREALTRVRRRL